MKAKIFNFNGRSKEGCVLSNFHTGVVVIDGKSYPSGEASFQSSKYFEASKRAVDTKRKADLLEYSEKFEVGGAFSGMTSVEIKRKGGKKEGLPLAAADLQTWGQTGIHVQKKICRYKFDNDVKVAQCLKNHLTDVLVHPSRVSDEKIVGRTWEGRGKIVDGNVVVLGGNVLGKLWMEIREELVLK